MAHIERSSKQQQPPRPLKTPSRSSLKNNYMVIEELIQLIENVALGLQSGVCTSETMIPLVQNLRIHGPQLETISKDSLDRAFVVFRNASQDERLNIMTRLKLLELIELRAKSWEDNGSSNTYYKTKQATNVELPHEQLAYQQSQHQHADSVAAAAQSAFFSTSPTYVGGGGAAAAAAAAAFAAVGTPNQQHMLLGPGEVIRNSGKFVKPTKIPGKTYCKDEVVIRNADSGKVMGIKGRRVHMIEELSETIISFQRVNPGAKERLVQITGPAEEKINYAKQLMEDTIRRNASPVRLDPAPGNGGGSCSSLGSSNSDDAIVQPRTPGGSSIANRLSFNSAQNFMTAAAAAQQISQQHPTQHQQQNQVVANHNVVAATSNVANAAAGKALRSNQQTLMHSYSTNDASVEEYKHTVRVGSHNLKITGDSCDLVRIGKLLLEDYFSNSEFLASFEAGAAFDGTSVISPISTPSTTMGAPQFYPHMGNPLQPSASIPLADSGIGLNYMASGVKSGNNNQGDGDDDVFTESTITATASQNGLARSRRSHFSRKDSTPESSNNNDNVGIASAVVRSNAIEATLQATNINQSTQRIVYNFEHLLYFSKSPHSWNFPDGWKDIVLNHPSIIRNKDLNDESQRFDGEKYATLMKSSSKRNIVAADETITDADE